MKIPLFLFNNKIDNKFERLKEEGLKMLIITIAKWISARLRIFIMLGIHWIKCGDWHTAVKCKIYFNLIYFGLVAFSNLN